MKKGLAILLLTLFLAAPSRAEDMLADLSEHEIDVTTSFTGARLLIFGVAKKQEDVAVVIEGPPVIAKLWTKKRKMGLWINDRPVTFDKIPGYYAVVSSKPTEKTTAAETSDHSGLSVRPETLFGFSRQYGEPAGRRDPEGDAGRIVEEAQRTRRPSDWLEKSKKVSGRTLNLNSLPKLLHASDQTHTLEDYGALTEAQKDRGRYLEQTSGVHISKGGLFRADIELPASVPIGEYKVNTYLLKDGKVLTSQTTSLSVTHVGVEARINHLAHERPFVYALLALISSLALGGGAAYLFRRHS
jgi:hypothetical protein